MNNEENKCNKYEGYFIFQDEEKLKQHLNECEECKKEHEKFEKISALVKEVAPVYLEREKKKSMMKSVQRLACCLVAFIGLTVFTGIKMYDNNYDYQLTMETDSAVSDMGLPVDDYGFLLI